MSTIINTLISIYVFIILINIRGDLGDDVTNSFRALIIILLTYLCYRMIDHNSLNRLDIGILINIT